MSDSQIEQKAAATPRPSEAGPAHAALLAVAVRGASKEYSNGLRALEALDLEVREGPQAEHAASEHDILRA